MSSLAEEQAALVGYQKSRSRAPAFDHFLTVYRPKYPKAAKRLEKDCESLLAFCDLPTEHWFHIRTTNPIESTFATVRLRKCFGYSHIPQRYAI